MGAVAGEKTKRGEQGWSVYSGFLTTELAVSLSRRSRLLSSDYTALFVSRLNKAPSPRSFRRRGGHGARCYQPQGTPLSLPVVSLQSALPLTNEQRVEDLLPAQPGSLLSRNWMQKRCKIVSPSVFYLSTQRKSRQEERAIAVTLFEQIKEHMVCL